jgi:hypothetical protein
VRIVAGEARFHQRPGDERSLARVAAGTLEERPAEFL